MVLYGNHKKMTQSILLELDIPPSSNNQYLLVSRGRKTFHVPSKELTTFKTHVSSYPLRYPSEFKHALKQMKDWIVSGKNTFEITCSFYFRYSRIYTKQGNPKRLDCSNRLKSIHDCVSLLFGIDDSLFFKIHAEKKICGDLFPEKTIVEILPI